MMERIVLAVFLLSEWLSLSTCLLHQYHFFDENLTWTEAQTYCRRRYRDLATVENAEEMRQLTNTVSSAGSRSDVWIGLYTEINWSWSDGFNGSGAEYRNWHNSWSEPDFHTDEFCVICSYSGKWWYDYCNGYHYPFICSNGTQLDPGFVLVNEPKDWSGAQRYCRENHIDLVTVRDQTENLRVQNLVPSGTRAWIGLFRDPDIYWSDGSRFSYNNLYDGPFPIGSMKVMCAFKSSSGRWKFSSCDDKRPFFCHGPPRSVKQRVVKLRLRKEDSVDLNDPAAKAELLQKLQDRLKDNGVTGVPLKWREQPDGKVFHREEKERRLSCEIESQLHSCMLDVYFITI